MSLRVALIGNMNNNHFAMMRYLRDLRLDAHLFMYSNEAAHFYPQHDTWEWDKWSPYVHQLPFSNGGPDSLILRRNTLLHELRGFDFYIGNGISPVLFKRMGRPLDLFIPYGDGVEFIIEHHIRWRNPRSTAYSFVRKRLMESALARSVKAIATANMHPHSQGTYERLGLETVKIPLLGVYVEPQPDVVLLPPHLQDVIARMQKSSLTVFSHVAHIWKNLPAPHYMAGVGKRNQWLVQGFAEYVREASDSAALLCLLEYCRDVGFTKALIEELGIAGQVVWIPKTSRREIMCLLPYADVGGSEFAGMLWGGCGWEFLASGVPMLHQLSISGTPDAGAFPLPPFFNVQSPAEICQVLVGNDRASFKRVGEEAKKWFNTHQGYSLAKRYVDLIDHLRSSHRLASGVPLTSIPGSDSRA